jgi:YHS domain-containing protein
MAGSHGITTQGLTRRALSIVTILASIGVSGLSAFAGPEIYTGTLSSTAAGGYDVVAYFTEGRPVQGAPQFSHRWKGATWHFASAASRDAFATAPERYAPSYGGHCSWAASQGYRASGDPRHWRIVDGRLFFNYDARVHRTWLTDIAGFIRSADRNWPSVVAQ